MSIAQAVEMKLKKKKLPKGDHVIDPTPHPIALSEGGEVEPFDMKRKERFHKIMAEHYARGGMVEGESEPVDLDEVPDFGDGADEGVAPPAAEDGMAKMKARLKKIRGGL